MVMASRNNTSPGVQSTDVVLTPLQTFIHGCLLESAKSSLMQAGIQGGYVDLPTEIRANPTLYITPFPSSPWKTPYWSRYGRSYAPSIPQIEQGIARLMEQDIVFCLNDFEEFKDLEIQQISDPKITFRINENDVLVDLKYSITFLHDTQSIQTDEFVRRFPIKLKPILDTAYAIAQAHNDDPFLARATVDLMALDGNNIPLANIDFRCQEKRWYVPNIKRRLQEDLLYYNIPRIRIQNTNHIPFRDAPQEYLKFADITIDNYEQRVRDGRIPEPRPADLYEFQHYYWDVGLQGYKNIGASLRYLPQYPMTLDARPHENGMLSSQSAQGNAEYLSFFCLNVYKFTYDIEYPVEVTLVDADAFGSGDPFVLRFALPVTIVKNIPATEPVGRPTDLGFDDAQTFCGTTYDEPVYIFIEDAYRNLDIHGVQILYDCGGTYCDLGTTQLADNGAEAKLTARIPSSCFGGEFIAQADHIVTARSQWDNTAQNVVIPTYQIAEVPTTLHLGSRQGLPRQIVRGQVAYLTLRDDQGYTFSEVFDGKSNAVLRLQDKPAQYNVSITVFTGDVLVGGFAGVLDVSIDNLRQNLELRALEDLTPPRTDEEIGEFFLSLQDETTYEGLYAPEWTAR